MLAIIGYETDGEEYWQLALKKGSVMIRSVPDESISEMCTTQTQHNNMEHGGAQRTGDAQRRRGAGSIRLSMYGQKEEK